MSDAAVDDSEEGDEWRLGSLGPFSPRSAATWIVRWSNNRGWHPIEDVHLVRRITYEYRYRPAWWLDRVASQIRQLDPRLDARVVRVGVKGGIRVGVHPPRPGPDDGSAGVREPRRPVGPSPAEAAAAEPEPDGD